MPLADRGLFQTDQADPAVGRFPRDQCQRRALAGVDSALGLLAVALCRVPFRLEPQLQSPFHRPALGVMEKVGFARVAPHLWDSRWSVSLSRLSTAGLSPRIGVRLWDSTRSFGKNSNNQL